eukprot:TRINITY_DN9358_c0_g1_i1.p1 TRINITY_DN9358_c0_g1~~TRINITY_DN9358_c0_g1_i1.p1  ORF type:complete len:445 (-),score=84.09 TRINITY_DN9358_c0_g1_i1:30-1364(-)
MSMRRLVDNTPKASLRLVRVLFGLTGVICYADGEARGELSGPACTLGILEERDHSLRRSDSLEELLVLDASLLLQVKLRLANETKDLENTSSAALSEVVASSHAKVNSSAMVAAASLVEEQTGELSTAREQVGYLKQSSFYVVLLAMLVLCTGLLMMWLLSSAASSSGPPSQGVKFAEPAQQGQGRHVTYTRPGTSGGAAAQQLPSAQDAGAAGAAGLRPGMPPTGRVPAASAASSASLPPLCESLVMPQTQARFMIKFDSLQRPNCESLDINSTTGRTLLKALLSTSEDGHRFLKIVQLNCEDDPRVIVSKAPGDGDGSSPQALEVRGRKDILYGTIEISPGVSGCVLKHRGQRVMTLEEGVPADLRMSAYAMDRSPLGAAGRTAPSHRDQGDDWRITVKPGIDALLVMACMLAKLLLAGPAEAQPGFRDRGGSKPTENCAGQ